MDLDLVKSEILREVFREGMAAPIPASERQTPLGQASATWPARALDEARTAEKLTTVKTPLPKFFNPLFRPQNLINRALIASTRAGADGLAEMMQVADRLDEELEVLRRLVFTAGDESGVEGLPQLRRSARAGESIIVLPWILQQTARLPAGATVMIGDCAGNLLNLELASLGFKVIGLDERECRDDHPNFKFIESNPIAPPLAAETVDAVIAISSLGRASPGALPACLPAEEDWEAMRVWSRVLKPGGVLLLAIPFGKASATAVGQPYDSPSLDSALKGWKVETREFAKCAEQHCWLHPVPEAEAGRAAVSRAGRPRAVALILARK